MMSKCMVGLLVGLAWCAATCLVVPVSGEMCLGKPYPSRECSQCCQNDGNVAVPFELDSHICKCVGPMRAASYARDHGVKLVETKEEMKACNHLKADSDEVGTGYDCEICCGRRLMTPKFDILKRCRCHRDWKIKHRRDGSTYIGGTGLSGALGGGPGGVSMSGGFAAGAY